MSAGNQVDRAALNYAAAQALLKVHQGLLEAAQVKQWADAYSAQDLVDNLGFTLADASDLKTALDVIDQLRVQYQNGAVGPQLDYQTFARRVFGLGV